MDIRKVIRWVVNIGSLIVAALTLPQLGATVPETWLPVIGSIVAIVNLVLSTIRSLGVGVGVLTSEK
jgi:hypothetical protein